MTTVVREGDHGSPVEDHVDDHSSPVDDHGSPAEDHADDHSSLGKDHVSPVLTYMFQLWEMLSHPLLADHCPFSRLLTAPATPTRQRCTHHPQ